MPILLLLLLLLLLLPNFQMAGRLSSQKPTLCCNEPIDLGRVVLQI
jgi:hypothetical protein